MYTVIFQIFLGCYIVAIPFFLSRRLARRVLDIILTRQLKSNKFMRLSVGGALWTVCIGAGLYFILNPIMPGSSTIYIDALKGGHADIAMNDLHITMVPVKKDGSSDFTRIRHCDFSYNGRCRSRVNLDWGENRVLIRVHDLKHNGRLVGERVVHVSPFARAGFHGTDVSLDSIIESHGSPLRLTYLFTWSMAALMVVLLAAAYIAEWRSLANGRRKGHGKIVHEPRPSEPF
jgi:hypothetical protein